MQPQNNPVQPVDPTSLPPVSLPSAQPAAVPAAQNIRPVTAAQPSTVASTAKRILQQYGNDPYRLTVAMQQLKMQHLSTKFNITPQQGKG